MNQKFKDNYTISDDDTNNLPELGQHYYKSRNSLLLFSGLLLAWELIGINLEEATTSGLKVKIQNTEAIPYVILLLVIYFVFRLIVEWMQSNIIRRKLLQSRIDFVVSLIIPFLSISIYIVQKVFGISVFERYQFYILLFLFLLVLSLGLYLTPIFLLKRRINKIVKKHTIQLHKEGMKMLEDSGFSVSERLINFDKIYKKFNDNMMNEEALSGYNLDKLANKRTEYREVVYAHVRFKRIGGFYENQSNVK